MRIAVVALALGLGACANESSGALVGSLWNTTWVAENLSGNPVVPPGVIILTFQMDQVSGNGGCNNYGGSVDVKEDAIKFGSLASTKMACLDEGRMKQETAFFGLLQKAVRYQRTAPDRLEIMTADGRKLVFAARR